MICILVRDFAITQERYLNPTLENVPLILAQADMYRPKVIAMDTTARGAGVKVHMGIKEAQSLCPMADIVFVQEERYQRIFKDITCQLLDVTDRIEPEYQATSAVWYTDDDLIVSHLINTIQALTGIQPQIGVAGTKFPARVAGAVALAGEQWVVSAGDEAQFLSSYPVTLLPLDKFMARRLPLLGIHTLGQFADLPRIAIWEQFGKHGRWLHDLANGKDVRPLSPYKPPIQLKSTYSVDDGLADWAQINRILEKLSLRLVADLDGRDAQAVTVLVHLEDRTLLDYQRQPHQPVRDSLFLFRLLTQMVSASSPG